MKHFWVTCLECEDSWVESFMAEYGMLIPVNSERCPDCGGEYEVQDEWEGGEE